MSDKLLKENEYPAPPTKMKVKYLLKRGWPIIPFTLLVAGVTVASVVSNGFTPSTLAMAGLLGVTALLGLWVARWYTVKKFRPFYQVHGVNVKFTSPTYYVPPEVMGEFLEGIINRFEGHTGSDLTTPMDLCKGVSLVVQDTRPRDPLKRIEAERVVGLSYTKYRRISYIYGPYALSAGGLGYELMLQCCAYMYPERAEKDDIAWMKSRAIL